MNKGKPSRTAIKVATSLLTLGAKPEAARKLPDGLLTATEAILIASGVVGEKAVRWCKSRRMLAVYDAFDWMLPGQFDALGARKAFCERQVRAAIGKGATQVLVLGAGFDTLGWRLAPEFPHVNFFEIDHPATAAPKAKGIAAMGARDNLHLIAADLGQRRLVDMLAAHEHWNPTGPSVIVAEGLLMYLPPDAVANLFRQCADITGPQSPIAFTYIPAGTDGRLDAGRWTGLMLWLQKMTGEPWLWAIAPEKLGPFLAAAGWRIDPQAEDGTGKHGVEYFAAALKAA